jgi:FLVCR family MFS transporter 7
MSGTERLDFTILVALFGVLVAAVSTFSIFTNQIFVCSPFFLRSEVAHIANEKGTCRILVGSSRFLGKPVVSTPKWHLTNAQQGATLLAAGLIGGIVTAPLFDRVLTHHLALTIRCTLPFLAGCWIGLVFAGTFIYALTRFWHLHEVNIYNI